MSNNIIVYSKTFEAHVENLQEVFDQLKEASLKLIAKKCQLFSTRVVYLGYQVSAEGISTDSQKIYAIQEWPQVTNVKKCANL